MGLFQHPHLTRGIVKTATGAFVITRGLVEMPDDLGEALGWQQVDPGLDTPALVARTASPEQDLPEPRRATERSPARPQAAVITREDAARVLVQRRRQRA
jgi:hypothetical protein